MILDISQPHKYYRNWSIVYMAAGEPTAPEAPVMTADAVVQQEAAKRRSQFRVYRGGGGVAQPAGAGEAAAQQNGNGNAEAKAANGEPQGANQPVTPEGPVDAGAVTKESGGSAEGQKLSPEVRASVAMHIRDRYNAASGLQDKEARLNDYDRLLLQKGEAYAERFASGETLSQEDEAIAWAVVTDELFQKAAATKSK